MTNSGPHPHRKLVIYLTLLVIGMFGFGFALVPLYNVLCKNFGINGKTAGQAALSNTIDDSRVIEVHFMTTNNANLPWTFFANTPSVKMHPGENTRVVFFARNDSDHTMTIQAIPSVSPGFAAKYLKKTECFCFTQQTLKAHEAQNMPVLFHIDPDLPADVNNISLSYTLFDTKNVSMPLPSGHNAGKISG